MAVDPQMFTKEEKDTLRRGGIVDIGGKRYGLCRGCYCVVCLNKRFFGSFHFCKSEDEENEV